VALILSIMMMILPLAPPTSNNACYSGWEVDYYLGTQEVYPRASLDLGCPLVPFKSYVCTGWSPGQWDGYRGKISVRPLYNDSGLPVYEVFRGEILNLVGFEFRVWDPTLRYPWGDYDGFSIALTPREIFLKLVLEF